MSGVRRRWFLGAVAQALAAMAHPGWASTNLQKGGNERANFLAQSAATGARSQILAAATAGLRHIFRQGSAFINGEETVIEGEGQQGHGGAVGVAFEAAILLLGFIQLAHRHGVPFLP